MDNINRKRDSARAGGGSLLTALIAGAIGLAVTLVLAFITPLFALRAGDPSSLVTPLAIFCVAVGGFVGAFVSVNKCDIAPIVTCAVSAWPILVVMLAVTLISPRGEGFLPVVAGIGALVLSALAGMLAAGAFKGKRRRGKKHAAAKAKPRTKRR